MEEFALNPNCIERSIEPSMMAPNMARVLQHIDVTWLDGRVRRGAGWARTKIPPSTTTVIAIGVFERYDGNRMIIDHGLGGDVRIIVPEGLDGCPRSVVEYGDTDDYATVPFCENFNEEDCVVPDPDVGGY